MQEEKEYPFITAAMIQDWVANAPSWADGQEFDFDLYGINCTLRKNAKAPRPYEILTETPTVSTTLGFFDVSSAILYLFNRYGDLDAYDSYASLEDALKNDSWFEERHLCLEYREASESNPDMIYTYTIKGDVDYLDEQLDILRDLLYENEFIPSDVGISDINSWCKSLPDLVITDEPPSEDAMTVEELINALKKAMNGWKKTKGDIIPGKQPYIVTVSETRSADVIVWATNREEAKRYAGQQHNELIYAPANSHMESAFCKRVASAEDLDSELQRLIAERPDYEGR